MSNVIQFPQVSELARVRERMATTWVDYFTNVGSGNEPTCAFLNVLFNLYKVGAPVVQNTWKDLSFDLNWDPQGMADFRMFTAFRKNLVPEFAVQDHTEVWSIVVEPISAMPIDAKPVPNDLLQELNYYVTGQFPELNDVGFFSFMIQVLSKIVESPNVRYISHGVENGKFVARFFDQESEKSPATGLAQSHILTYTADNLPTLLDAEAMRMARDNVEKNR
ncbi:hypothetical protein [Stenotrophomonas sp. GD03657]|uniref:hypothetical protein n=1 Tax=Stenotrophomonas sp. GD03657 TaxID=2975363 RepID=UPI002448B633|nr:hypothetical protein [Stenotrophomonas sp. GD03657]MDH2154146.1 hypothetical protein [Stenotrophomonas sp. GD03657]